jgi:hypothetical protein
MQFVRMLIDAVLRAARILQTSPGYSMPLARLHAQLIRELGPQAGSYGEIYQQLKKRTDSFIVIDAARVLSGADNWPSVVREAYDSALEHAGMGACARVTLTSAQEGECNCELVAEIGATVATLTACCDGDEALAAYVERAARQLAELHQLMSGGTDLPTTPLPDPPPSA